MKNSLVIGLLVAVLLGLLGSVYVVREDQTAMVLNLGKVVRSDIKPGLHFKVPLVETVRVFDRRFQVLDTAPARYFTAEQKDVSVDFFAIGYISDVRAYYRATGGDGKVANARLAPIITDSLLPVRKPPPARARRAAKLTAATMDGSSTAMGTRTSSSLMQKLVAMPSGKATKPMTFSIMKAACSRLNPACSARRSSGVNSAHSATIAVRSSQLN